METKVPSTFKQVDDALAQYYEHLHVSNYCDSNNDGLFLNYIKTEELDHPQLPIEEELGDKCDPYDCTYTEIWMNSSIHFPIPSYAQIPDNATEAFIFYILQYCYKHSKPPTDKYIQNVLIPQCNGTINPALLPQLKIDADADQVFRSLDNVSAISNVYEITILVNWYLIRLCGGDIIHQDIINCIQLYLFGKEGSMYCDETDDDSFIDDDCIADIDGERLTVVSNYAIRYYNTVSKNKRDFCMEMKRYYKASYGKIVKVFKELVKNSVKMQSTQNMYVNLKYQSTQ